MPRGGDDILVARGEEKVGVVKQDIEETLLQCERDVKRKKQPKEILPPAKKTKKGEPKDIPQPIPLTDAELAIKDKCQDLISLLSDSEDETPEDLRRKALAESKKATAEEKKAASKAAKEEARKSQKDMKKNLALSHKVITLVKPLSTRMDKFQTSTVDKMTDLSDDLSKSFKEKKAACATWVSQATEVLKMTAASNTFSWDCCNYEDDKSITAHMKDCNKIMKDLSALKRAQGAKA